MIEFSVSLSVLEVVSKRLSHTGWKRLCIKITGFSVRRLMSGKVAVLPKGPKENINILFMVEHFFTSTSVDVKIMFLLLFN